MRYIMSGTKGMIGEFLKRRLDRRHECVMEIDIRNGFNILDLFGIRLNPQTQHTDMFIHAGAHCKIQEGIDYPELPHLNNANGTFSVLEFCRKNGIKKFMNFSSSRVLSPEENPYTASKKYGENLARAYQQCYGIDFINVRPSTVYGPVHDITSRLITTWIQTALKGGELKIFGNKDKTLDFTYVDDFVDGIELLIDNWEKAKNQDYNISGNNEVRLRDLAFLITQQCGGTFRYCSPEIAQPQNVSVDISRMRDLGYNPKVGIEEGVKRMIEFYRRRKE